MQSDRFAARDQRAVYGVDLESRKLYGGPSPIAERKSTRFEKGNSFFSTGRNDSDQDSGSRSRFLETFTVYHRLSLLVVLPNAAVIIYQVSQGTLFDQPTTCLNAVAANVAAAALIRQDYVINFLFTSFALIQQRAPLRLRWHIARLYHLGSVHSGTGVASGMWLVLFNVSSILNQPHTGMTPKVAAIIALCLSLDVLLLQMLVFSIPTFRHRFHNVWELFHRFSGWLLLILFWGFLVMYNIFEAQEENETLASLFYTSPTFWLLATTTGSILLPWLRLRRVTPQIERLSPHALRLHFDYATVGACRTPRFSTSPLTEWHSFASIPNYYSNGYSVIISRAGDWTGKIIDDPPSVLWTRGHPACGVLYMAKLFRKVLCVATGSGIAPILGLLTMPNLQFRILWSAKMPAKTYGADIVRRVVKADPRAILLDTRDSGRFDLVQEATNLYEEEGDFEAVFVISNSKSTKEIVSRLEERGIPAFGPIFDS